MRPTSGPISSGMGGHTPVMLKEVLNVLAPRDGGIYVDGTFGAGGYSSAVLNAADCRLWAVDRDPSAIARGQDLVRHFAGRLVLTRGCFGDMASLLEGLVPARVDGVAFDVGVSSMQLDEAGRGFSLKQDGPLDMRMGDMPGRAVGATDMVAGGGQSAREVVMTLSESQLADIIFTLGEERKARQVARAVTIARAT